MTVTAFFLVPREVAEPVAASLGIRVLPLTDDWAQRRFAICFNDEKRLSPAARILVEHLHQVAHDEAQAAG